MVGDAQQPAPHVAPVVGARPGARRDQHRGVRLRPPGGVRLAQVRGEDRVERTHDVPVPLRLREDDQPARQLDVAPEQRVNRLGAAARVVAEHHPRNDREVLPPAILARQPLPTLPDMAGGEHRADLALGQRRGLAERLREVPQSAHGVLAEQLALDGEVQRSADDVDVGVAAPRPELALLAQLRPPGGDTAGGELDRRRLRAERVTDGPRPVRLVPFPPCPAFAAVRRVGVEDLGERHGRGVGLLNAQDLRLDLPDDLRPAPGRPLPRPREIRGVRRALAGPVHTADAVRVPEAEVPDAAGLVAGEVGRRGARTARHDHYGGHKRRPRTSAAAEYRSTSYRGTRPRNASGAFRILAARRLRLSLMLPRTS